MNIEELTPEQLANYCVEGNRPHEIQMRELGIDYKDLPSEIKSEIRAVLGSFRFAKSEAAINKALNRSVVIADMMITFSENGRADAPTGPTPEEIEAQRLADEEAQRLANEQAQQEEQQRIAAEAEAKRKAKSFGIDSLDIITGNW